MFFSSALLASSHARLATSMSQTRPNLTNTAAPGSRAAAANGYYGEHALNETTDGRRRRSKSPVVPSPVSYYADDATDAASGVRDGSSVYLNDSFYAREMKMEARSEKAAARARRLASATRRLPRVVGDLKKFVSVEGAIAAVEGVLQRNAELKYGAAVRELVEVGAMKISLVRGGQQWAGLGGVVSLPVGGERVVSALEHSSWYSVDECGEM